MSERFDLLKVSYVYDKTGKDMGLCFAPCCEVSEGDTVETALGRAFVLERAGFCSPEDKIMKMIGGIVPVHRVLFKLKPIKYEEDENGLSQE